MNPSELVGSPKYEEWTRIYKCTERDIKEI